MAVQGTLLRSVAPRRGAHRRVMSEHGCDMTARHSARQQLLSSLPLTAVPVLSATGGSCTELAEPSDRAPKAEPHEAAPRFRASCTSCRKLQCADRCPATALLGRGCRGLEHPQERSHHRKLPHILSPGSQAGPLAAQAGGRPPGGSCPPCAPTQRRRRPGRSPPSRTGPARCGTAPSRWRSAHGSAAAAPAAPPALVAPCIGLLLRQAHSPC